MGKKPKESLGENLQVFKVQRPLFDSEQQMNKILVYNEDQSIWFELPIGSGAMKDIFGTSMDAKVFVRAKIMKGKFYIHNRLRLSEWPEW